jgi:hypothetical protein
VTNLRTTLLQTRLEAIQEALQNIVNQIVDFETHKNIQPFIVLVELTKTKQNKKLKTTSLSDFCCKVVGHEIAVANLINY